MVLIPDLFNGFAKFKKFNILKHFDKTEDISIFSLSLNDKKIEAKYIWDYHSSVWIRNKFNYERFDQQFAVISGGWYGHGAGGRWSTIKKTFGEIVFVEVENYNKETISESGKNTFRIMKRRFSNKLNIEIRSSDNDIHIFECNKIEFFPSYRILLKDKKTDQFVDKTEILAENGLGLLEDLFDSNNIKEINMDLQDYNNIVGNIPKDAQDYYNSGMAKGEMEDYLGAIQDFTKAINIKPPFVEAYYNRGYAKEKIRDYRGAIEDFTKAINIKPTFAEAYFMRGAAKGKVKDLQGEIIDYAKAVEINPNLLNAYSGQNVPKDIIENNSDDAETYYNLGFSKVKSNDYRGAIEDFTKAIRINPNYTDAYNNRGIAKDKLGDYRGAMQDYSIAVEVNPNFTLAFYNLGSSKVKLKDYKGAIDTFTKAVLINPIYAEAYNNRGIAKYNLQDYRGSIQDYTKALELKLNYVDAYFNRGISKYSLSDKAGACSDWRKAGELGACPRIELKRDKK